MDIVADSDYKCLLDDDAKAKAKKELGEDPSTRILEVQNLRKRLEKVPGLKARTDIKFLLRFLRVRKFDQEKAFNSVKKYYAWKQEHPELFQDLKPSRVQHMLDSNYVDILANRDKDNCKVLVVRAANWDEDRYSVYEPIKLYAISLLQLQEDELNQVHGVHLVVDLGGTTWKQTLHMTPSVARLCVEMPQAMVPLRLKRIDYVHQPGFFNQVFPIFKQFMKEKLVKRLCLKNEKYEGLHESVGKENLPTHYGGTEEPFSNTAWKAELMASESHHEEENKFGFVAMGLDSEKKTSKMEDAGLKGLGGTFKKLEL